MGLYVHRKNRILAGCFAQRVFTQHTRMEGKSVIAKSLLRFPAMAGLLAIFCFALFGQMHDSTVRPVPKVVKLDVGTKDYLRVLGGPPETSTMRSGLVVLAPGKSVGKHSTEQYEELVIPLEGKGEMRITGGNTLSFGKGEVVYCPSRTEHDVVNTGSEEMRYVYVVAKTSGKERPK